MYWFWYITITCKVLDKNPERWLSLLLPVHSLSCLQNINTYIGGMSILLK